jgi:hypothetical protein
VLGSQPTAAATDAIAATNAIATGVARRRRGGCSGGLWVMAEAFLPAGNGGSSRTGTFAVPDLTFAPRAVDTYRASHDQPASTRRREFLSRIEQRCLRTVRMTHLAH